MLIANDAPFEKLTPEAFRMAFPLKFSAPEGSLQRQKRSVRYEEPQTKCGTHTILRKFANGVPVCCCGDLRGMSSMIGRPLPKPAPLGPPPVSMRPGMSETLRRGALRPCLRAARPLTGEPAPPRPAAGTGAEAGARALGGIMFLSDRDMFLSVAAAASTEWGD